MKVLVLNSSDLESLRSPDLVQALGGGLQAFSEKQIRNFPRTVHKLSQGQLGLMPAESSQNVSCKLVSVFPNNRNENMNPHQGLVALFNPSNGRLESLCDGSFITAVRTAAASAAATKALANPQPMILGFIGCGRQAQEHLRLFAECFSIKQVVVFSRNPHKAREFAQATKTNFPIDIANSPQEVAAKCNVLNMVSSSSSPMLATSDLQPGTHVNLVGACRPGQVELEIYSGDGLRIFPDSNTAVLEEAEEIIAPIKSGRLTSDQIIGELGQVLSKRIPGRTSNREITIFKSVGLGLEDLCAAEFFVARAKSRKVGQYVEF